MGVTDRFRIIAATAFIACSLALPHPASGSKIDWQQITRLKNQAFLRYVGRLELHGQAARDSDAPEAAVRCAHTLKGVATNTGAARIQEAAGTLDG